MRCIIAIIYRIRMHPKLWSSWPHCHFIPSFGCCDSLPTARKRLDSKASKWSFAKNVLGAWHRIFGAKISGAIWGKHHDFASIDHRSRSPRSMTSASRCKSAFNVSRWYWHQRGKFEITLIYLIYILEINMKQTQKWPTPSLESVSQTWWNLAKRVAMFGV